MEQLNVFQKEFIDNACYRLDESLRMVKKSMRQVDESAIWKRPNESSNSIGNLVLHLCGNMTQYGIASLRGEADTRNRDLEFSSRSGFDKNTLLEKLEATVTEVKSTIRNCRVEELLKKRKVQGYEFSGIGNIVHIVEHFSYHTGQIAFWVKLLKNRDLGFYDGVDLNVKNG